MGEALRALRVAFRPRPVIGGAALRAPRFAFRPRPSWERLCARPREKNCANRAFFVDKRGKSVYDNSISKKTHLPMNGDK